MIRNGQLNIAQIINRTTSAKSEKRRHFRLSLHLPVEYSFPESSRPRLAYTVDICEGGLSMYSRQKLEIGKSLKINLYYDSSAELDCIQVLGEVIRVDRLGKSGKEFWCAVSFFDLSSETLKQLRKFLKSLY